MNQKSFIRLVGCGIKSMWPIFKIEIHQSKANIDVKILVGKITHLRTQKLEKRLSGISNWESRIPQSILIHDLFGIEIQSQCHRKFQK